MRLEIFITSFMSCSTSTTVIPDAATLLDHGVDLLGLHRVAAGGGLIEQQHLRLGRERARDFEALERAIGHRAGGLIGQRGQSDERQQFLAPCARLAVLPQHGGQREQMRAARCGARADAGRP